MKKLPLKWKVTIWYTIFTILIAAVSLVFVIRFAGQMLTAKSQESLQETVSEFVEDIELSPDGLDLHDAGFYEDEVTLSVYNQYGALIAGSVPSSFPGNTTLKDGEFQSIAKDSRRWSTYDIAILTEDGAAYWARGILYSSSLDGLSKAAILLSCMVLPALVLVSAFGGYRITKHAFAPVAAMRKTAEEITQKGDLKQRIPVADKQGELHELAATYNRMLQKLDHTFEEEKQFTSDASHELRTPISVISAQSEYALLDDITEEERKEILEIIHEQADKMSLLVSQLLMIARSENASGMKQFSRINISEILNSTAEALSPLAKEEKNIQIIAEIPDNLWLFAEENGFARIIINLIQNAIQYGKQDGHIRVKAYSRENCIFCVVADDGIGIAPKDQEQIFRRFFRVDKVRTGNDSGHAGLGLAMVKTLVSLYGGSISLESTLGTGSCFTLQFPVPKES